MFRILKTTTLGIGFFILCHCAHINNAKSISSSFLLTRMVDSDEGLMDINYSSHPQALNFTIEEIDINGAKLDGFPRKSRQLEGSQGVYRTEVYLLDEKFPIKKDTSELTIKTKWQGESSNEQIDQFSLPPSFAVESITSELSPTKPIHIKFKEKLLRTDWSKCELNFNDGENNILFWKGPGIFVEIFSAQDPATDSLQEIDLEFQKVKDAFGNRNLDIPSLLKVIVRCDKIIKNQSADNSLYYTIKSVFLVNVHR